MHQSVATIDSPEFINLEPVDINPLMSKCEIKVLYVGENRNRSYITKEVATEMSKSLRGAPIVGYYKESKEDFADHGEKVTIDDEGIHFECQTVPYGFVAPDAKVWFQKFNDTDDFGNDIEREYLMTTGYLWTGQFEECAQAVEGGKPQSMELDEKTLNGSWSTNIKSGMEFFIINDAIFSKLCILGDDVEPCFEGASVTAPKVSSTFSMDETFKNTLFNMIQDLRGLVSEGGTQMDNLETPVVEAVEEVETEFEAETVEEVVEETAVEETPVASDFKKEDTEEEDSSKEEDSESSDDEEDDKKEKEKEEFACAAEDEEKKKYSLLESQYSELQDKYTALEAQYNELVEYKNQVEDAKKDELIDSFYMLSEEDKKDVIDNKSTYSYNDIKNKLSVIFTDKQLASLAREDEKENDDSVVATFTVENNEDIDSLPNWLKEVRETEKSMNI